MKILFAGQSDWGNVSHRFAVAINAVAPGTARVYVREPHPFGYVEDLVGAAGLEEARALGATCAWIVSTGDGNYDVYRALVKALGATHAERGTMHVGTAYRTRPHEYNALDAQLGFAARLVSADSYRFCQYESALAHPFPLIGLTGVPIARLGGDVTIAHSPSSRRRDVKGTAKILRALAGIEVDVIEGVPHDVCMRRRAKSRIFIDQINPIVGGFGQSTVEALSQGLVTLVDVRHIVPEVWERVGTPPPPLINVQEFPQLRKEVERLLADHALLRELQVASLRWVKEHATQGGAGRYLLDVFEGFKNERQRLFRAPAVQAEPDQRSPEPEHAVSLPLEQAE